jgi:hypothetical protein
MYESLRPKIPVVINLKMLIHSFRSEMLLLEEEEEEEEEEKDVEEE